MHWFDRQGRDLGAFDQPRTFAQFRLAPDGHRVAVAIPDWTRGSRSIWILEAARPPVRFTYADTHDWDPVWSFDGRRIGFASYRNGPLDLFVKDADGAAVEAPLVLSESQKDFGGWSPDGWYIAYRDVRDNSVGDIIVAETANPSKTIELSKTPQADERLPRFSGDGKWIAYVSEETGREEVIVPPFPPTGSRWQISVDGGDEPEWRGDGRELFYLARGADQAHRCGAQLDRAAESAALIDRFVLLLERDLPAHDGVGHLRGQDLIVRHGHDVL